MKLRYCHARLDRRTALGALLLSAHGHQGGASPLAFERNQSGFTLIEVCVALAVLSGSILVFGRYLEGFNRIRTLEREQAKSVVLSADVVEEFVRNPPPCVDSSFSYKDARVEILTVPGTKPLAWVRASVLAIQKVELRRLVRCRITR